MKTILLSIISLALAGLAAAEVKFPRHSFTHEKMADARKLAAEEKKPIAYVYTDKLSTCSLCNNATAEFLDAVKSKAVVVYLDSKQNKDYWNSLPAHIRDALAKTKFIPAMAVASPGNGSLVASITYDQFKADGRGSIRELKKCLR